MLIRRATASVYFRTHIVFVYPQYISAKMQSNCAYQPQIAQQLLETPIFVLQGRSRWWMFIPTESSSAVLVIICSKSESICNYSRATVVHSSRNPTLWMVTEMWCALMDESLNLGGEALHRWNLRLMQKSSYPHLSWSIVNGFVALKYLLTRVFQREIAKNLLKTVYWGFMSFKVV